MVESLDKTEGRDSYCRAEHLTGLLGGAERYFNRFSPFIHSALLPILPLFF